MLVYLIILKYVIINNGNLYNIDNLMFLLISINVNWLSK
jgi:hypothetical protein